MFDIIGGGPAAHIRPLISAWEPEIDGRSYADIVAYVRLPEDRHKNAWFDVYYAHRAVVEHTDPVQGQTVECVDYQPITRVATLPAPPVIPVEERLAALDERLAGLSAPTLEGWTEDKIRMIGGEEAALKLMRSRQEQAVRADRSPDIFDWQAAARAYVDILETIPPRKLTAEQRALVGQARVAQAEEELVSARRSLRALQTNAGQPQSEEPAGPGRPSTGDSVKVNIPTDHIARLDALAEERGTTRAALVRAAVAAYLIESYQ